MFYKSCLLGGSLLALISAANPALAQSAAPAAQANPQPAQSSDTFGAGEIVVTANKREQNLNKVGLSVSALSGEALANQRISNVEDLAKATPGLAFAPTVNATPVYTLRGVGFFEASLAAYPDVSTYIDQVPLSLPVMSVLTAFDLERVEVLKGPQGTLFGNNATGGAINFVAAKPTREFAAGAEFSYGRFNTIEVSAFISGPITDTLRARLAIKSVNGDEWQKSYTRVDGGVSAEHLALGTPASLTGKQDKLGKLDNIAGRFLLDWDASDTLKFSLNVNGWRNQDDPQAAQYTLATPQNPAGSAGFGGVVPANLPFFVYPKAPDNARAADWNEDLRPYSNTRFWQAALRTDWDILDNLTLTSITGYNKMRFLNGTDGDGTALQGLDIGRDRGDIKSFTQELRLSNGAGDGFRYTLGANFERTTVDEQIDLYIMDTSSQAKNGFNGNQYGSYQKMKNYAVFGNAEYDITDQITLKGGIRYTEAKRTGVLFGSYEIPDFYAPGAFGTNSLTNFFNAVYAAIYGPGVIAQITPGNSIALDTRPNSPGFLKTGNPIADLSESSTSWSVGADFKPTDNLLFYANVSKGYKAGSYPTLAGAIYDAYAPVKQEALLDYEVGFKAQLMDRRLSINGAAFYYDYKNKQLRAKFVDPIFGALDKLVNVPKSKVKGAEIEINARPFDGLSFSASATYLDAKVRKYDGVVGAHAEGPLLVADTASFNGVKLPFAPKVQYNIRADYDFPVSDSLAAFVGVGVNGQSKTIGVLARTDIDAFGVPASAYTIKARTLVNGNIGIRSADDRWRFQIWGKNIFNKFYWTNVLQAYDNLMRYAGRPAEYGASVAVKF